MDIMNALLFRDKGRFDLTETDGPGAIGPKDVLIEVKRAGICGTDLHIFRGTHPANPDIILGHEYAGVVAQAGDSVTHLQEGDAVVIDPNVTCGTCFFCRNGMSNQCDALDTGTTLGIFRHGGFARFNVAPSHMVYKAPKDMDMTAAALVEPLSCVLNGVKNAAIQPEDTVVVLGAGPIGLLFTNVLSHLASLLIVSEVDDLRAGKARQFTPHVLDPKETDIGKEVRSLTDGRGANVVVDATGVLMGDALGLVAKGGKVVLFGMNSAHTAAIRPYDITRNEIQVIGTYIANRTVVPAMTMLHQGRIDVEHYVDTVLPLDDIYDGFRRLGLDPETGERTPMDAVKVLVKP
ncbi:MAG: alcohol dehydrogenase catalytic domain-containing protein [Candidatus Undinarchaeales archaeon]|jgi:threonine dehydrogenase-like Zn-dependent dehydrogenase|nr:alcohol dehydrogenase catalytic domain-containing protein [Candidatus Undinarchaeales archaeon]MDP7493324.1 alcohol dehydrogenase catalytic domain-containing protein [Candidatus Undinarchaeales archaeon]